MSDHVIRRIIRESGVLDEIRRSDEIRQSHAVSQVVDPTGALIPAAVRPFLTPKTYRFFLPGAVTENTYAGADRIVRAGTLVRLDAYAGSSPSSGSAVIDLVNTASESIATVTIPAGSKTGASEGLGVTVAAGTWITPIVRSAGGAANLSVVVTQQLR